MSQRAKASFVKIPLEFVGEPILLSIICRLNFYISKKGAIFAEIWHIALRTDDR